MVLPVLQRRVVGKRMKPEGWCCVVALLFIFWPCACIPCFLDQCQEDVVVEEYIMVRRAHARARVPCGDARRAERRSAPRSAHARKMRKMLTWHCFARSRRRRWRRPCRASPWCSCERHTRVRAPQ